jgi:hypothetical protein
MTCSIDSGIPYDAGNNVPDVNAVFKLMGSKLYGFVPARLPGYSD